MGFSIASLFKSSPPEPSPSAKEEEKQVQPELKLRAKSSTIVIYYNHIVTIGIEENTDTCFICISKENDTNKIIKYSKIYSIDETTHGDGLVIFSNDYDILVTCLKGGKYLYQVRGRNGIEKRCIMSRDINTPSFQRQGHPEFDKLVLIFE
jgi:hypothetical protein